MTSLQFQARSTFLKTCFSVALLEAKGYPDGEDSQHRNGAMLIASYGLIGAMDRVEVDFFKQNKNGESPFYFAVKNCRWNLLKHRGTYPPKNKIDRDAGNYKNPGDKLIKLLKSRARNNDVGFFKGNLPNPLLLLSNNLLRFDGCWYR